jgi:hypothetical protein
MCLKEEAKMYRFLKSANYKSKISYFSDKQKSEKNYFLCLFLRKLLHQNEKAKPEEENRLDEGKK